MLVCIALVCINSISSVSAVDDSMITVMLDGNQLEFDVPPQIINNRTMVPMRLIFEALGAVVEWDGATQTVTAVRDNTIVIMKIDNQIMFVDDHEITIDTSPSLINGRTLVPVRAVAEGLGTEVDWDTSTRTVIITSPSAPVPLPTPPPAPTNAPVSSHQADQPMPTLPPNVELVSWWKILYMDPSLKMSVMINNPEWIFQKISEQEQVFFFNNVNQFSENLISISAFPFSGNVNREISRLWDEMREIHRNAPNSGNFKYNDRKAIQVGGKYSGYLYSFEAVINGEFLTFNAVFWNTDEMMYICTTSANETHIEEVQKVLDGLIESFSTVSDDPNPTPPPSATGISVTIDGQNVAWTSGAEPYKDGTAIMLPLKKLVAELGGTHVELEVEGQQRIVFALNSNVLLIFPGFREYATTSFNDVHGMYAYGESITRFLNKVPVEINDEVFFPLRDFSSAFMIEFHETEDSIDFITPLLSEYE